MESHLRLPEFGKNKPSRFVDPRCGSGGFHKRLLPPAKTFYEREGLKLHGRGEWRSALCPFHDDRNPSLKVNTLSGAFRCFSCNAHGGDVLAFHRLRTGMGFVEAAKALGAWEVSR